MLGTVRNTFASDNPRIEETTRKQQSCSHGSLVVFWHESRSLNIILYSISMNIISITFFEVFSGFSRFYDLHRLLNKTIRQFIVTENSICSQISFCLTVNQRLTSQILHITAHSISISIAYKPEISAATDTHIGRAHPKKKKKAKKVFQHRNKCSVRINVRNVKQMPHFRAIKKIEISKRGSYSLALQKKVEQHGRIV